MEAESATQLGLKKGMCWVCTRAWGIGEMWRDCLGVLFFFVPPRLFLLFVFVFVLFSPLFLLAQESHQDWESYCSLGT